MTTRTASSLALALAGLVAGAALAGCGADSPKAGPSGVATTGSPSPGAVPSGYPSGAASEAPKGTALTAPGTELGLGERATVAWAPSQQTVGVLDITVGALHRTTFADSFKGWQLDAKTKANTPFFVEATVKNAGTSDLSGQQVPLYGAASSGALVEATSFASSFKPCEPGTLPTPFPAGASVDVCLVYLVPGGGSLDGVMFRPTQEFNPISWSGSLTPISPAPKPSASATLGSGTPSPDNRGHEPATPR
ncbi:hypothetical protein [Nocardioides nematodiphilus]|uniref:hypothetical protein n=1 Tax=Nocardioides nematodiphilus TaxID=2849669 RepID=UPI001CD92403|nr:hypothetical protein [Nocardioides nematodiphilus]MCA1983864.1 hypothetical protein [Nocardioides nematodiphilus]